MTAAAYAIAVLPGDGIGHEVIAAAERVMLEAATRHSVSLVTTQHPCGAFHYQATGRAIDPETMVALAQADATLFGAAGWPDIRDADGIEIAPQIDIREHFQLFAGLRPIRLWPGVPGPLKSTDVDMLVIREQTEGLFAGRHDPAGNDPDQAQDRMVITRAGCERLFELAFAEARRRRAQGKPGHVTLFDKANVLRGMALMRRVFDEVAERHPDIPAHRLYIDNAAMLMVTHPGRFDVIVMENQFGDIVSEIAAGLAGGLGIASSADIGPGHAVFQPSHGTAPDIAGKGLANPVAAILSAALLLDHLAETTSDPACHRAAEAIRAATAATLELGPKTRDLGGTAGTHDVAQAILEAL
jgi:3-isopropylmalate dehydrogenase